MKKVDIYSSAGTTDESSTNADILQASQPIAKSPCNLKKTVEVVKKVVNIKSLQ